MMNRADFLREFDIALYGKFAPESTVGYVIADYIDSRTTSPTVVTIALNPPEVSDTPDVSETKPDAFAEAMTTIEQQAKRIDTLETTIIQALKSIREQYSYEAIAMMEAAINTSH